jgi:hypothetical protein
MRALLRLACSALALLSTLVVAPSAMATTITLVPGPHEIWALAKNDSETFALYNYVPTTFPVSGSLTVSDGPSTSTTHFDLSDAGFFFTFDHHRSSAYIGEAVSYARIYFMPTANVDYLISGAYAARDEDGRQLSLFQRSTT